MMNAIKSAIERFSISALPEITLPTNYTEFQIVCNSCRAAYIEHAMAMYAGLPHVTAASHRCNRLLFIICEATGMSFSEANQCIAHDWLDTSEDIVSQGDGRRRLASAYWQAQFAMHEEARG